MRRAAQWLMVGWCWFALLASARGEPLFDRTDHQHVQRALQAILMTDADLGFDKEHSESMHVRTDTLRYLRAPLTLPADAERYVSRLRTATNLVSLMGALHPEYRPRRWNPRASPGAFTVEKAVANITAAAQRVRLPRVDSAALNAFLFSVLHVPMGDPVAEQFPAGFRALQARGEALELGDDELARLWLPAALPASLLRQRATWELLAAIDEAVTRLSPVGTEQAFERVIHTPMGTVIVGGGGPNTYRQPAFLILDLGGDDTYAHAAASGNGLARRPISIVIDWAGNDQYVSTEPFAQAAAVYGVGILVDAGGDNEFHAGHFAQGAVFHGLAILWNRGGQDRYRARQYAQGAATFGTAVLWSDAAGTRPASTVYGTEGIAQGFASVGGTALLLDGAGDDQYTATGYDDCRWLPGHRFTLAQGFGYGVRPWAGGGLGLLVDLAGDDSYEADVYGQGAAYWYATGMLLDAAGNDRYRAYQYCQGAGIHLAAGLLADWAGDDAWEAHAICQGSAHDYSVGMLIDRQGNDRYRGRSTAQGTAIHNSVALLLDRRGDDVYDGGGPTEAQAAGHDGGRRQFGSIALLLDLAGDDSFSQGHSNNTAWIKRWYGCGWDVEAPRDAVPARPRRPAQRAPPPPTPWLGAAIDPYHPVERLLRRANSDRENAAEAWNQLKAGGIESLRYLVTRLNSPDVMIWVRTEDLVDHLGAEAVPVLMEGIRRTVDSEQARSCAYLLARFPDATNAIPVVLPLLKRADSRSTALYTLGHLRARQAIPAARRALRDRDPLVRMRAAQALGRIGDQRAVPLLLRALEDEWWHVRYAAQDALAALSATNAIHHALPAASARARAHLIEALAQCGDARALDWQRQYSLREPVLQAARLTYLEERLGQKTVPTSRP